MKSSILTATALLLLATSGCTSQNTNSETDAEADVARYQELAAQTQSAAADYRSAMMGQTGMDALVCRHVHDRYYEQTRPWLFELHQMAPAMDETMHMVGGINADHACVSNAMRDEFDQHHSVACTWNGLSENLAEVQRHVEVMTSYAAHLQDRCSDMMTALHGNQANWGPMMIRCDEVPHAAECDAHPPMMRGGMMHDQDCD